MTFFDALTLIATSGPAVVVTAASGLSLIAIALFRKDV